MLKLIKIQDYIINLEIYSMLKLNLKILYINFLMNAHGVLASAARKRLKQKISQTKIKRRPLRNHYYLLFLLST